MNIIIFGCLFGYLCGSLLFEELYPLLSGKKDAAAVSADHNPGVFNAFRYGGFAYGLFTLAGDLGKGILPVLLYIAAWHSWNLLSASLFWSGLPFILVCPVLGHLFSLFFRFHGGEGIAVTFGVLLALWIGRITPWPVLTMAALFLFFKLMISPDLYLTMLVYLLLPCACFLENLAAPVVWGLVLISLSVLGKLAFLPGPKPRLEVRFLWKH